MGHAGPILICGFHQADPWTGIGRSDDKIKAGSRHDAARPDLGRRQRVGTAVAATLAIGLGVLVHMLRSRRLYERAAVAAIVLAALAGLAGLDRESRAKARARLTAWITGQNERLER